MNLPLHDQLIQAPADSLWLLTCTTDDHQLHTDVLARRLPHALTDPDDALFELLLLGERVLVNVDQIHDATPATLIINHPADHPTPPGERRLRLIKSTP